MGKQSTTKGVNFGKAYTLPPQFFPSHRTGFNTRKQTQISHALPPFFFFDWVLVGSLGRCDTFDNFGVKNPTGLASGICA